MWCWGKQWITSNSMTYPDLVDLVLGYTRKAILVACWPGKVTHEGQYYSCLCFEDRVLSCEYIPIGKHEFRHCNYNKRLNHIFAYTCIYTSTFTCYLYKQTTWKIWAKSKPHVVLAKCNGRRMISTISTYTFYTSFYTQHITFYNFWCFSTNQYANK